MAAKPRFRAVHAVALGTVVLVGALVGVILLVGDGESQVEPGKPEEVSEEELRSYSRLREHPVYWAGSSPGQKLELTETSHGHVFVRYLPEDVAVGDPRPAYTTVATYPRERAFEAAERAAERPDAVRTELEDGGIAVTRGNLPTSVYIAYPDADVLVEVYARTARDVRRLALSGQVEPVL